MDPITMALLGGTSLASGALGYLGSKQAGKSQQQAAMTSGLFGLIAQQQAQQQAQEQTRRGAAAAGEYYGKGTADIRDYYNRAAADLQNYYTRGATDIRDFYGQGVNALRDFYGQGRSDVLGQANQGEAAAREFYGQGVGYQQPYMETGAGAVNRLASLFSPGGEYTRQPTLEELQMDPGYAFRTREGERALAALQGSSGLRGSGAAMKAALRYGQEAGSQEYQSAYNRFMANRAAATQGLQSLASGGLSAAGAATGLAGQTGTNLMANRFSAGANLGTMAGQTGANIANVASTAGSNLGTMAGQTGSNLANVASTAGSNLGTLASNAGATTAGAYTGSIPTMAALTSANPYGQAMENVGQARASSYMGGVGALSQALNTIPQNYMTYSILNRMQPQTAAAASPSSWDQFSAWRTSQGY